MTTMNAVVCPECKESYSLLEGKLPPHHANGDPCPMGGRDPLNQTLVIEKEYGMQESRNSTQEELEKADAEVDRIEDTVNQVKGAVPPAPKAKRRAREYIVASAGVEVYTSLEEAKAMLGEYEAHLQSTMIDSDVYVPPVLIVGRVLKTKYVPSKTIPATVKVIR